MTKRKLTTLEWFIFILAIAGLLVDGYLTIVYLQNAPIVCGLEHGCDIVRASKYSHLWGIPISTFGVAMYLFLAGMLAARPPFTRAIISLVAGLGTAISAYLVYLQLGVIHAICLWCMLSAGMVTLIFLLSLPYSFSKRSSS